MINAKCLELFNKTKDVYPFISNIDYPAKDYFIKFDVIIANKKSIEHLSSSEKDYLGDYSMEAVVFVPYDYLENGCHVYCKKWANVERIPSDRLHFELKTYQDFTKLCIGVTGSFARLKNPILESIKTAEHVLTAYKLFLLGYTTDIILIDYAHNNAGIEEYKNDKKRYQTCWDY